MPDIRSYVADADFDDWDALFALITDAFQGMDGRIDPPSSLGRMTSGDLARLANDGVLVVAYEGSALVGCGFGTRQGDALYLSKLAVDPAHQRRGILRKLTGVFCEYALDNRLTSLTLQTRVELVENHATFQKLGFENVGETRHPGYDRVTSLSFRRPL